MNQKYLVIKTDVFELNYLPFLISERTIKNLNAPKNAMGIEIFLFILLDYSI